MSNELVMQWDTCSLVLGIGYFGAFVYARRWQRCRCQIEAAH